MGLDTVELLLELEDAFGIKIPDNEATGLVTIGDIIDCVASKLGEASGQTCATASVFYQLRRDLVSRFGVTRLSVRPNTSWASLLTPQLFRRFWAKLRANEELLPSLRLSHRWILAIWVGATVGGVVFMYYSQSSFIAVVLTALLGLLAHRLSTCLAGIAPQTCQTIGDTALFIAIRRPTKDIEHRMTTAEIEKKVRLIISQELKVPIEKLERELKIVNDLGLG